MLEAARSRPELKAAGNIEFRAGFAGAACRIDDGEVDLAIVSLVLHHVAEPAAALGELRRCVRPGGAAADHRAGGPSATPSSTSGWATAGGASSRPDRWPSGCARRVSRMCGHAADHGPAGGAATAGVPRLFAVIGDDECGCDLTSRVRSNDQLELSPASRLGMERRLRRSRIGWNRTEMLLNRSMTRWRPQ